MRWLVASMLLHLTVYAETLSTVKVPTPRWKAIRAKMSELLAIWCCMHVVLKCHAKFLARWKKVTGST